MFKHNHEYETTAVTDPSAYVINDAVFTRLYNARFAITVSQFLKRGYSEAEAEDLAQEVFLRVWANRRQFKPERVAQAVGKRKTPVLELHFWWMQFVKILDMLKNNGAFQARNLDSVIFVRSKNEETFEDFIRHVAATGEREISPRPETLDFEIERLVKDAPPLLKKEVEFILMDYLGYEARAPLHGMSDRNLRRKMKELREVHDEYFKAIREGLMVP